MTEIETKVLNVFESTSLLGLYTPDMLWNNNIWYNDNDIIFEELIKIYPESTELFFTKETNKIEYFVWLNDNIKGSIVNDIMGIQISNYYYNLICKLANDGKLKFNYTTIVNILNVIRDLKENDINDEVTWKKIRGFKNSLFGYLLNNRKFYCNDVSLITVFVKKLWEKILSEVDDIYYIDTDCVYLKNNEKNINNITSILKNEGLPYKIGFNKSTYMYGNWKRMENLYNILTNEMRNIRISSMLNDESYCYHGYFHAKKTYLIF